MAGGYIASIVNTLAGLTTSPRFEDSPDRKNLLIIDELAQLPKINNLKQFLEAGRSKGCPCILATQTPAQLREIYGENDLAGWMAMFGLKIFLQTTGAEDLDFVLNQGGPRTAYVPQISRSISAAGETITHSFTLENKTVIPRDLLEKIGPKNGKIEFILKAFGSDAVLLNIPILTQLKPCRPALVDNPRFNVIEAQFRIEEAKKITHHTVPASPCSNVAQFTPKPDVARVADVPVSAAKQEPQPVPAPETAPDAAQDLAALDAELCDFFKADLTPETLCSNVEKPTPNPDVERVCDVSSSVANTEHQTAPAPEIATDAAALESILADLEALGSGRPG